MNYFAHGRAYTHDPYFLAGTAIPDWLSMLDRQTRVRAKRAKEFLGDPDPLVATLAAGIARHHADDDWFHQTTAFHELNVLFAGTIREALKGDVAVDDHGYRPAFLGHILVELLLDATLIEDQPALLDDYYTALQKVDGVVVQTAVNRMAAKPTERLATMLPRFISERFLYDYVDDVKLLLRLNQVMRRVGLAALPASLASIFPMARRLVRQRQADLLGA